jgi:hypothetical protein
MFQKLDIFPHSGGWVGWGKTRVLLVPIERANLRHFLILANLHMQADTDNSGASRRQKTLPH